MDHYTKLRLWELDRVGALGVVSLDADATLNGLGQFQRCRVHQPERFRAVIPSGSCCCDRIRRSSAHPAQASDRALLTVRGGAGAAERVFGEGRGLPTVRV